MIGMHDELFVVAHIDCRSCCATAAAPLLLAASLVVLVIVVIFAATLPHSRTDRCGIDRPSMVFHFQFGSSQNPAPLGS